MTRGRVGMLALSIAVALGCANLGLWQGRRLAARRRANALVEARRSAPEVDLNRAADRPGLANRRVRASGTWDHPRTIVLRGRVEREAPGVHWVTPLRLEGLDQAVLVLRGFVPAADALRPDTSRVTRPERGVIHGVALAIPVSGDSGGPLQFRGTTTWQRLDRVALPRRLPYPILDEYVQAVAETAAGGGAPAGPGAFPTPASLAPLDDGPHLSYMIQWFGIGAAALVFGLVFFRRAGRLP